MAHSSLASRDKLERHAVFLLSNEMEEKDQESAKHAKKLAERIAELIGTETGDPDRVCNVVSIEAPFYAK